MGLVCLSVFGLAAWRVEHAYKARIDESKATTAALAHALADQVHAVVHEAELLVSGVAERLEQDGASEPVLARLHRTMVRSVAATPWLIDLVAFSADGESLASSVEPLPKFSIADRPYFAAHRAGHTLRPLVGAPIKSRIDSGWVFTVSKRMNRPDGSFGGAAVALVGSEALGQSFRNFQPGPGSTIGLISEDAILIARQPFMPNTIGKSFATAPIVLDYRERGPVGSIETFSGIDGQARVGSYRRVDGSGLVILVSLARDDVLAPLRREATIEFGAAASIAAAIGLLGWRFKSQLRRRDSAAVKIRRSEKRYRLLADHSTDVIMQLSPDGRRQYVSPACQRVLGYEPYELVGGHPRDTTHPEDWPRLQANLQEIATLGSAQPVTYRIRRRDGVYIWVETHGKRPSEGESTIVTVRDISQRKRVEALLHEANNHLQEQVMLDGLTGIPNRRAFDLVLEKELRRAVRSQTGLGLLVLDVDKFKLFNDRYGHQPGDTCLRAIAQCLAGEIRRPADFAARYGGEEFVVLLPDTDEAGALAMAERIRAAVERLAIQHADAQGGVATVSIGVAVDRPQPSGTDGAAFVRLADAALYQAKANGRNRAHMAAPAAASVMAQEDVAAMQPG